MLIVGVILHVCDDLTSFLYREVTRPLARYCYSWVVANTALGVMKSCWSHRDLNSDRLRTRRTRYPFSYATPNVWQIPLTSNLRFGFQQTLFVREIQVFH